MQIQHAAFPMSSSSYANIGNYCQLLRGLNIPIIGLMKFNASYGALLHGPGNSKCVPQTLNYLWPMNSRETLFCRDSFVHEMCCCKYTELVFCHSLLAAVV